MVKKTKLVEFVRYFNPKTHKLIYRIPTADNCSAYFDSEIRQAVPFSVYSEIYNTITGKKLEIDGFSTCDFCSNFLSEFEDEESYCCVFGDKDFIDYFTEEVEITYPKNADYYLIQWENSHGIWQNDNSFKTLEQALEYCDNDLNKYELMRIIPQYFGKTFQEEPKERY